MTNSNKRHRDFLLQSIPETLNLAKRALSRGNKFIALKAMKLYRSKLEMLNSIEKANGKGFYI